jgi:hypothetical protein
MGGSHWKPWRNGWKPLEAVAQWVEATGSRGAMGESHWKPRRNGWKPLEAVAQWVEATKWLKSIIENSDFYLFCSFCRWIADGYRQLTKKFVALNSFTTN